LAGQIIQALNLTLASKSAPKLSVQLGAYASFLSFFGLSQLPAVSDNFTGIPDYASSMAFELVTNSSVSATSTPTLDQIYVRFLFSNGSAAYNGGLQEYPLFGQSATSVPWATFVSEMGKISIGDQETWCSACGNTTGVCANTTTSSTPGVSSGSSGAGTGISTTTAGVIGAMVTLGVILGAEALVLLLGRLRVVRKKVNNDIGMKHQTDKGGEAGLMT
jgi:hypothetical protein